MFLVLTHSLHATVHFSFSEVEAISSATKNVTAQDGHQTHDLWGHGLTSMTKTTFSGICHLFRFRDTFISTERNHSDVIICMVNPR